MGDIKQLIKQFFNSTPDQMCFHDDFYEHSHTHVFALSGGGDHHGVNF